MKKNELTKKSRKIFSVILAGAILTTSVIPESLVWAAEAEEVQGFGDSESMGFESTPDPMTGDGEVGENQELSDFQGVSDIQNGNDIEEGFTDEIASFGSIGRDIPVEELSNTNTISPGENVTITVGGTYKIAGGEYTAPYKSGVINIDTTEEVTLEIEGNINVAGEYEHYFIYVQSACPKLMIKNEQNYTVNVNACQVLGNGNKDATVTFNQGTYTGSDTRNGWAMIHNAGVINFNNVIFHTTDQEDEFGCGIIVLNYFSQVGQGRINIYDGTILKNEYNDAATIFGGTVNMYGGTIKALSRPTGYGIEADSVNFVGGTIDNFSEGIDVHSDCTLSIGGNATFEKNAADIRLEEGATFTIKDDFKGTASIWADNGDITTFPRQITTPGTSPDMRAKITYAGGYYSVNYNTTGKYLELDDHAHSWNYSPSENRIIAKCTKEECGFNPDKLDLTLTATDEYYSGKAYTGAAVTNNITYATGDEASTVYYLKDGALTNSSNSGAASEGAAPVKPGDYTVKVTLGGQTISADFKIKIKINPTVTIDGWTYGEKANTPKVTVKSGGSDITNLYDASQITYRYYTDENCTNVTTATNGADTNGAVPKNAGTYYVKAAVAENGDYAADSAIAKFTIKKAAPELKISAVSDKNYGEEAFNLEVSNNGDGVKSYKSSNNAVVTVDENGRVTIVGTGTATLTVSLAESANYVSDEKSVTVNVKKIDHSLVVDELTYEVTYGDSAFKIAANPGDTESGIHFTSDNENVATVSADGTVTIKTAGTARITVSMDESQNYLAVSNEVTVTVAPKEITVKITPNGGIYEGAIIPATAALNGLVGEDKPEITLTYTGKANDGTEVNGTKTPALAGTYTVTASITDSNYNLKAEGTTAEFVVTKANPGLSVAAVSDKIYGGEAFKLEASHKGDGLKSYASSNDKVVTVDEKGTVTIVGAGTATLTVSLAESANYAADRKDVTVTVVPKEITVTADNQKKIIGEADPILTYTADGLVGEDTLSGITVKRKAGEKVGTYAVTVSQEAGVNPNYRITFEKGTFTIQQADQSKLKGKDVYRLKLPAFFAKGKAKKNSITLSWKKYAGATGYDVYWRYCDGSINYKKVGTAKNGKLSMLHKKLKKDREYKYFIAAYKMVEGRKIYIAKSNGVHIAMKQAATTNVASIKVNKTKVTLSVGKTFKLKCSIKAENSRKDLISHTSSYRYYTTNSKVATVSKAGVIQAKEKGTCNIYVLANNGVYKKVKVKVK